LNVPEIERKSVAGRTLIALAAIAVIVAILTLYFVYSISHDFYVSAYYTIGTLFDAVGINVMPTLQAYAPPFSERFDALIALSIIDGFVKIVAVGIALAAIVEILSNSNIITKVNSLKAKRLKNHTIICGYSDIGANVAMELKKRGQNVVIVDKKAETAETLFEFGYKIVNGDFTSEETLKSAGIEKARAILFAAEDDLATLIGIITAKHLNDSIKIISRASEEASVTKMQRGGAEICVVPEILGGIRMGDAIRSKVAT
jgi:voltage-gated potassium channel